MLSMNCIMNTRECIRIYIFQSKLDTFSKYFLYFAKKKDALLIMNIGFKRQLDSLKYVYNL